ncbi:hypothetical protein [Streptomyces sp. NPDC086023]|uniref:hypothetical protein n=1 Tax=Streptomyces sp. NPDC086023 TaxID=3365746 RepID=UPI0037CEBBC2
MEFFGPWVIRVEQLTETLGSKITLAGTDGADGDHFPVPGQALEIAVTGDAWTISVHTAWPEDDGA